MKISIAKTLFFSIALLTLMFAPAGNVLASPGAAHPNRSTRLVVADLPPEAQLTIASSIQRGQLTASDGAASDQLGWAVAISGDGSTIVVGAPWADGGVTNQGAAYVFVKSGGGWGTMTQTAKLTNASGTAYDWFGCSVAISADGGVIAVGAFNASINASSTEGAAYVYVRPVSGWATTSTYAARLGSTHRSSLDLFGYSVGISANGNTIVVGAHQYDDAKTDQGGAYVFVKPVSGWGGGDPTYQTAELLASSPAANDHFGTSVAISGDGNTIVAGAPNVDDGLIVDEGAAYVFLKPGGGWTDATQTAELFAAGTGTGDLFGSAVSISDDGNTVAASAPYTLSAKGQAYVFLKPGGGWIDMSQNAKLNASDGASNDWFGTSVSISRDGNMIAAGASGADVGANANQGAAYSFTKPAGGWTGNLTQASKQTASDGAASDGFGISVSVNDAGQMAAGASSDDIASHVNQGSAYEFAIVQTVMLTSIGAQDGWVLESAKNSKVGGTVDSASTTLRLGDDAAGRQYRGILSFATGAPLPDSAIITAVTLKVKKQGVIGGGDPVTMFQGIIADVKKGAFGTAALQAADFQTAANKTSGPSSPGGVWLSMNITGAKAFINKLAASGGLTQIRLRFKLNTNNNTVANYLSLYSGNAPAASRPQLIVQYYVP